MLDEDATSGLVRQVRREARNNPPLVAAQLLDCAVQLAAKAPVYALLVGERGWDALAARATCDGQSRSLAADPRFQQ